MKRTTIGVILALTAALTAGCAGPSEPEPEPSAPQGSVTLPGGPNVNDPTPTPTPSDPDDVDGPGPTPVDEPERRPGGEQSDRQATTNAHQVARALAYAQNWYGEQNQGQYFASLEQLRAFVAYMKSQGKDTSGLIDPDLIVVDPGTTYYILLDVDRVKFDIVAIGADGVVYEAWADGELKYANFDQYAESAYTVPGVPKATR